MDVIEYRSQYWPMIPSGRVRSPCGSMDGAGGGGTTIPGKPDGGAGADELFLVPFPRPSGWSLSLKSPAFATLLGSPPPVVCETNASTALKEGALDEEEEEEEEPGPEEASSSLEGELLVGAGGSGKPQSFRMTCDHSL